MNLKNYTSTVPVNLTVSRIEQLLAEAGASGVSKKYDNGLLTALAFTIKNGLGKDMTIRLPANADAVFETLKQEVRRPRRGTFDKLKDQASRTAWKLMQDWIAVQISLIQMQQADVIEVFLPYVWDGERTFYHALKAGGFKQLPAPSSPGS
jgi:hypothetical protein